MKTKFINLIKILLLALGFMISCTNQYEDDGNIYVANLDSTDISIVDAFSNFEVATITLSYEPKDIAYDNTSNNIFALLANNSGSLKIINPAKTSNNFIINSSIKKPSSIKIIPSMNKAYIASDLDSNIALFDINNNQILNIISLPYPVNSLIYNETNKILYCLHSFNKSISRIDITTDTILDPITLNDKVYDFTIDEEIGKLYLLTEKTIIKYDISNESFQNISLKKKYDFEKIIYNSNNKQIYISCKKNNLVLCVDTYTDEVLGEIPVGSNPTGISLNKKNNRIYVCNSSSNTISVIHCTDNKVLNTFPVGINPHKITFSN